MDENELVSRVKECKVPGTRKRRRPTKRWLDCVKDDSKAVDLDKTDDRDEWRRESRRPDSLDREDIFHPCQ